MKKIYIVFALIMTFGLGKAQDLNFDVKISTPKLATADPKIFKTLERSITEFFNNQKWSDNEFEEHEKIEASVQITITEDFSTNSFAADFYIQSLRPVYGSNYNSQMMNYVDKNIRFGYEELQPIQHSANNFYDNLSSILTFYAYMIIGLDYDSFSPLGGEKYFQTAQNVVASIPSNVSAVDPSWSPSGNNFNRFKMVENMLNPRVRSFRQAFYEYHRKSLDIMTSDVPKARAIMLSSLKSVQDVDKSFPNSMILRMFADSKGAEIVEIFKQSDRATQKRVYNMLTQIDPSQASQYSALK
jgi:hypothetical protein